MKHVFKKAVVSAAVLASLGVIGTANADVVDSPKFKILPIVVVWGGDGSGATEVGDFLISTGAATDIDLVNGDVTPLITGTLNTFAPTGTAGVTVDGNDLDSNSDGTLDASDALTSPLTAGSTVAQTGANSLTSSFFVASNTAFKINATSAPVGTTTAADLALISHTMGVDADDTGSTFSYGSSATANVTEPYPGGTLAALTTGADVIQVGKTATASGNIAAQSVRITNTYSVGGVSAGGLEVDPADLEATVTYVVSAI